jgi:parvulin-like peptidyl-prolyl isomerase
MTSVFPRRAPLLAAVLATAPLLGGCGQRMAVKVNGEVVSQDQFFNRCANYTQNQLIGPPVGLILLDGLINEQLMRQEARRLHLEITDADVDARIANYQKRAQAANQSLEQSLKQVGMPMQAFRDAIRLELLQQKLYTQGVTVTDKDIEDFYNQNKLSQFTTPEQVEARQITVASDAAAKEVRQTLDKGASFELVAHSKSIDTFKDSGGKLPPLQRGFPNPSVNPEVISRAFSAAVGKATEPFKVGNNWVVLLAEKKTPQSTKTLAEVKEEIRQGLLMQKATQGGQAMKFRQRMMDLRRDADIQIGMDQFKDPILEQQKVLKQQPVTGGPGGAPVLPGG